MEDPQIRAILIQHGLQDAVFRGEEGGKYFYELKDPPIKFYFDSAEKLVHVTDVG